MKITQPSASVHSSVYRLKEGNVLLLHYEHLHYQHLLLSGFQLSSAILFEILNSSQKIRMSGLVWSSRQYKPFLAADLQGKPGRIT
jgi:hypothetical protein